MLNYKHEIMCYHIKAGQLPALNVQPSSRVSWLYTVSQKINTPLIITLANLERFSKFFHC